MAGETNLSTVNKLESTGHDTGHAPSSDKMATMEVLHQRFWSCQADKGCWHEGATSTRFGRTLFDVPRGRSVDGRYRQFVILKGLDHRRERLSDFAREAEAWEASVVFLRGRKIGSRRTEDCVYDVICGLDRGRKVVGEGDLQIFQLFGKPLRKRSAAGTDPTQLNS